MRISPRDRYYALKFSEQYARDYKHLVSDKGENYQPIHGSPTALPMELSDSAKELCRIYNLRYPLNPTEPCHEWEIDFAFPIISYLISPENWRDREYTPIGEQDRVISHVNGKLTIMIDEGFSRRKIIEALESFLNMAYDSNINKSKGRVRESSLDIWEIYRLHKIEGKTEEEIIRKIYKTDEVPYQNDQEESFKKNVGRALEKAESMISAIEISAKSCQ